MPRTPETRETLGWSDRQPSGVETLLLALTLFAACRRARPMADVEEAGSADAHVRA